MDIILGLGMSLYLETQDNFNLSVKAQKNEWYVQAQAQEFRLEELGQGLGEGVIGSLSVGYELEFTPRISAFMEVGYGHPDYDVRPNVQTEMVYTHLVRNHNVKDHEVPVRFRPNQGETNGVHTEYELDGGFLGAIGLKFRHNDHWSFSASYRHFQPKEFWKLYDEVIVERQGVWWQENTTRDLSSLEFKVEYNF